MLTDLQGCFLDLLLSSGALRFGQFKTKSGRMSPFFLNSGAFDHGEILRSVARCYAKRLVNFSKMNPISTWHLYGPAYKGITLAAATAMELALETGKEVAFTFNRKEAKDHGEGGLFIGREISANSEIVIVEDVLTGGTSVRQTLDLLRPINPRVGAVIVGVDRMERGVGQYSAAAEIETAFKIPVVSILSIQEIIDALWQDGHPLPRMGKAWLDSSLKASIDEYRSQWGG
jgi:orotate phosphoribosyltransferase